MRLSRKCLCFSALLIWSWSCTAQSPQSESPQPKRSTASLAKPQDWVPIAVRLFKDSRRVTFKLVTSWIPGEKHKGMMRYKLIAIREEADTGLPRVHPSDAEASEELMKRVYGCFLIELILHDRDGFVLRKINVEFHRAVDDQARVQSLDANDSVQMDERDYREFIGTSARSGSFSVDWNCPESP